MVKQKQLFLFSECIPQQKSPALLSVPSSPIVVRHILRTW
jgi:hypothetical protein